MKQPIPSSAQQLAILVAALAILAGMAMAEENEAVVAFRQEIDPILQEYCHDCHGDGANKGEVAFDELTSDNALLDHGLWLKVLKNVRAGLMPPKKKSRPSAEEQQKLEQWIKYGAFGIDPQNPDPGRVTVRRLNRIEYRNTIRDLVGVDFNAEAEFPPDDTGYGFDNIGDVLTVSPMLLEKYLDAAKAVVAEAVPTVARVIQEQSVPGIHFVSANEEPRDSDDGRVRRRSYRGLSFYEPAQVSTSAGVDRAGTYRLVLELEVNGEFDFDPGKCRVVFKLGEREMLREEFGYFDNKTFNFEFEEAWEPGEREMTLELEPLTPVDQRKNSLEMRIHQVKVLGPLEKDGWVPPENYERYFTRDTPEAAAERRAYAGALLGTFANKAFRRPVDASTADRLAGLAESVYTQPDKSFEAGVAHAMVAVLASPRFLFRLEEPASDAAPFAKSANVDEYALASRLSYFLWSSMPDAELIGLAERGELRSDLTHQVERMLADPRSEQMIRNFTGQWLQTRDVEGVSINSRAILARDSGQERQMREEREAFRAFLAQREKELAAGRKPAERPRGQRRRNRGPRIELDGSLRYAMRRETEMFVASIVHEDRPVTELIDSDFTFLNEKLAQLYGIEGVKGSEMQRVSLPADSPRGGVLTQGSALVVTSNPDRTSPVKRGLFILENFLGTPAPPPPPNIPSLEVSEKDFGDHDPTLRQALELHREKPLCASCHQRMDPIGLAFENFNAMGMWRERERNQTIDTAGTLITGESFNSVSELKHILANDHRVDFYRCLTEKLMTYALGRGTEYYDVESIDQIVQRLEHEGGRFSALLMGVIESVPFQKMRTNATQSMRENEPTPTEP